MTMLMCSGIMPQSHYAPVQPWTIGKIAGLSQVTKAIVTQAMMIYYAKQNILVMVIHNILPF